MATSDPVVQTVTVVPSAVSNTFFEGFIGTDSGPIGVFPPYESVWNGRHLKMGNFRVWFDATKTMRFKDGAPSSDTDGTPVGAGGGFVIVNEGDAPPAGTVAPSIVFEV